MFSVAVLAQDTSANPPRFFPVGKTATGVARSFQTQWAAAIHLQLPLPLPLLLQRQRQLQLQLQLQPGLPWAAKYHPSSPLGS